MKEIHLRLKLAILYAAMLIAASIETTLPEIPPLSGYQLPCCLNLSLESPMTTDGHSDICTPVNTGLFA